MFSFYLKHYFHIFAHVIVYCNILASIKIILFSDSSSDDTDNDEVHMPNISSSVPSGKNTL